MQRKTVIIVMREIYFIFSLYLLTTLLKVTSLCELQTAKSFQTPIQSKRFLGQILSPSKFTFRIFIAVRALRKPPSHDEY